MLVRVTAGPGELELPELVRERAVRIPATNRTIAWRSGPRLHSYVASLPRTPR